MGLAPWHPLWLVWSTTHLALGTTLGTCATAAVVLGTLRHCWPSPRAGAWRAPGLCWHCPLGTGHHGATMGQGQSHNEGRGQDHNRGGAKLQCGAKLEVLGRSQGHMNGR